MPKLYDSAHVRAYAADRGIPLRTAQWRWKQNSDDVTAWRKEQGLPTRELLPVPRAKTVMEVGTEIVFSPGQIPAPPAKTKPDNHRTVEEHAEVESWDMFSNVVQAAKRAADRNEIAAAGFIKTAAEAHKLYVNARNDRIAAEIRDRQLITLAEYESLHSVVSEVMTMWDALGPDLARELSPGNPGVVLRVIDVFRRDKLNPVVKKFMAMA